MSKEQPERKILERHVSFDRVVAVVEGERKAKREQFRGWHGDAGRDMVLYLARQRSGMTLREIGEQAGGLDYKTVGKAAGRFGRRRKTVADLQT